MDAGFLIGCVEIHVDGSEGGEFGSLAGTAMRRSLDGGRMLLRCGGDQAGTGLLRGVTGDGGDFSDRVEEGLRWVLCLIGGQVLLWRGICGLAGRVAMDAPRRQPLKL